MNLTRRLTYIYRDLWTKDVFPPWDVRPWSDEPDKVYGTASDGRLVIAYRDWLGRWQVGLETKEGSRLHARNSEQVKDLLAAEDRSPPNLTLHGYATSGTGYREMFCFGYNCAVCRGLSKYPWMLGFNAGEDDTLIPATGVDTKGRYTTLLEALEALEKFRLILEAVE